MAGILGGVDNKDPIDELAGLFRSLAHTDFAGYSPIYEELALAVARDRGVLGFVLDSAAPNSRRGRLPVLFFAATHDVILSRPTSPIAAIYRGEVEADPVAPFFQLLADDRDAIAERMRTRSVQTNEVGRSAAIAAAVALCTTGDFRSIGLVEIGPSAGLNLAFDSYRIDYTRGADFIGSTGPVDSPVHLSCELRGDLDIPLPGPDIAIDVRIGIDAAPIDITDPEQSRWLRACLWPGIPDRPDRLAAAIQLVGTAPPPILCGDAVTDLPGVLAALPEAIAPIVISTWALAYIPTAGRAQILHDLDELGARRDLTFITLEEPRFTPWGPEIEELPEGIIANSGTSTILAMRRWSGGVCESRVLAFVHPHGRWMHWIDQRSAIADGASEGEASAGTTTATDATTNGVRHG